MAILKAFAAYYNRERRTVAWVLYVGQAGGYDRTSMRSPDVVEHPHERLVRPSLRPTTRRCVRLRPCPSGARVPHAAARVVQGSRVHMPGL